MTERILQVWRYLTLPCITFQFFKMFQTLLTAIACSSCWWAAHFQSTLQRSWPKGDCSDLQRIHALESCSLVPHSHTLKHMRKGRCLVVSKLFLQISLAVSCVDILTEMLDDYGWFSKLCKISIEWQVTCSISPIRPSRTYSRAFRACLVKLAEWFLGIKVEISHSNIVRKLKRLQAKGKLFATEVPENIQRLIGWPSVTMKTFPWDFLGLEVSNMSKVILCHLTRIMALTGSNLNIIPRYSKVQNCCCSM